MTAPRVLLSGVVLGQPMGGVRRHNAELLPRVASRLAEAGGGLAVMEGRTPIPFELPETVERLAAPVPARPALVRATLEGHWLRRLVEEARRAPRHRFNWIEGRLDRSRTTHRFRMPHRNNDFIHMQRVAR